MVYTLFLSVLTFLAGILTFRAATRVWKKRVEAWEGTKDSPSLRRIQRYARIQYRIRVSIGISFLLFSGFWGAVVYYFSHQRPYETALCLTISVFLLLWKILWGGVDALSSYIFLKKEDSLQIIAEEKEIINKKLRVKK